MDIVVRQTGFGVPKAPEGGRKRRRGTLSLRKKSRRVDEEGGAEVVGGGVEERDEDGFLCPGEKRVFSADVSLDNILNSTRRRLSRFSSLVQSLSFFGFCG